MKFKSEADELSNHVEQFLCQLVNNFEMVAIPPELVLFCHSKFNLMQRSQIDELICTINQWIKTPLGNDQLNLKLSAILPSHPTLKASLINVIEKEGSGLSEKIVSRAEFLATLQGSRCERVSGKEFVLDLQVQTDPVTEAQLATRSFVLSEEQISSLLEDMDRIRQQLFRSLEA